MDAMWGGQNIRNPSRYNAIQYNIDTTTSPRRQNRSFDIQNNPCELFLCGVTVVIGGLVQSRQLKLLG